MASWSDISSYINFAGLILDFIGFIILLREWWIAYLSQQQELELYQKRFRQEQLDQLQQNNQSNLSPQLQKHMEMVKNQRGKTQTMEEMKDIATKLKSRRGLYVIATALIMGGFLMQIVASIPFLGD
mmetsp:Transcript_5418/g.6305  ORF Transcript_5418/g.6305 Transcript_5418/m.6305 type:complete len:127 (+) Transcript_5418:84-464(+)|eukprot:CAMPEP_0194133914 /NCGR_PEP_ID=MMETSP0152-20130528/3942_1 /TAXON_ID=1049557 /ORGANISM="Thalassiothrix antarctica, Strain L6-D1" /LENGTH=126 /DNA_ID=CAMNT_0038829337 /DNA_START=81 /DNA_END=461 /DNA_ORIENTATION=-